MDVGENIVRFQAGRLVPVVTGAVFLLVSCGQDNIVQPDVDQAPTVAMTLTDVSDEAMRAMNADSGMRIELRADGWEACLGQPWNINAGWARWSLTDYNRVTDHAAFTSYQTALRQAGMDPGMLGGCGAQPDAAPQNQRSPVNGESSWEQQLQVHLTPLGFLLLAREQDAGVVRDGDGLSLVLEDINGDGIGYRMVGSYGDDFLLDHVITWIDNTVYGDMPFEAVFSDYTDFNGLVYPAHIEQKQGGYTTLDLAVSEVIPGTQASAVPPENGGGRFGGGQQPESPSYEEIGPGIWALHGGYQSVVMEFDEFSVVLDGLQNDERVREIIAITKEIVPDKPIGYVLTTHAHFDHAAGLRQFIAEGAMIITHDTNVAFFEEALAMPRTLNPDAVDTTGMPVSLLGVQDFFALDDGTQRVEFYKLNGSTHADDVLIAFIPAIGAVVEADLLQPWINPVFGGGDHPFLVWFADELERIGIDYEQFVPVHRPASPPLMTRAELMEAVGRL